MVQSKFQTNSVGHPPPRLGKRPDPIPAYHIYLKIAYHLSQEAQAGLSEFRIPRESSTNGCFDFQVAAVKIAAHHLNKRGGVLIGDIVGLGKTIMATALAKIFQETFLRGEHFDHLSEEPRFRCGRTTSRGLG